MVTLYQYLHCPYCVRANMMANYKEVQFNNVYLLNDDEDTCYRLIDAKMVPILAFEDGSAMGESLDIATKFDEIGNPDKVVLAPSDYESYTSVLSDVSAAINGLLFPRNLLIEQPEFATESAKAYFKQKKQKAIGMTFDEALDLSEQYIATVEQALAQLPPLTPPSLRDNRLSWDDIYVFPTLRNLTMVKHLTFPAQVTQYINDVAALTGIHLYYKQAV